MTQYIVTTPENPVYEGKAFGIRFTRGRALVSEFTIDPLLGYSVEEVARRMRDDLGYTVKEVEGSPRVETELAIAEEPPKRREKRGTG